MDLKMWECERETTSAEEEQNNNNNNKKEEISMHTIVFTLGTFLVMVCLKRFLGTFLVLNIILLAILFMSMKPNFWGQGSENDEKSNVEEGVKSEKKVKEIEEGNNKKLQCWGNSTNVNVVDENEIIDDDLDLDEEEEEEQVLVLSKEELNQRVEAFIAMFRQHLISDVKESEDFSFRKNANFSTKIEVPCC